MYFRRVVKNKFLLFKEWFQNRYCDFEMFQIKPSCVSPNGELGLFSKVHFSKGNILPLRRPGIYCSDAIADEINEYLLMLCNTPAGLNYEQHVNKLRRSYKINLVNKPQQENVPPNWDLIYDNFIVHSFNVAGVDVWIYWYCFDWQTGLLQPDPNRPKVNLDVLYMWEPIAYDYVYNEDANREQECVANVKCIPVIEGAHYFEYEAMRDIEPGDEMLIDVSPFAPVDWSLKNLAGKEKIVYDPSWMTCEQDKELVERYNSAIDNYKSKGVLYVRQSRKRLKSLHE